MPRVSAAERAARDVLVLRLWLGGSSFREIGRHPKVDLSCRGVELAIRRALTQDARVSVLSEHASALHVLRLQTLLRAFWPKALAGDLKAAEHCRRVLEQEARFYGLRAV